MIYKKLLVLLPLSILLVGCSSEKTVKLDLKYITKSSAPVDAVDKNAQDNLAESSTSISQSLQELAAIEQASHPDLRIPAPPNPATIHMTEKTSVNWTGPVEPLLRKVAKSGGYQLQVVGIKPVIPVIIGIDKHNVTLAEIFQDIRYQVVNKAQIRIYPKRNIIELRYMKN